jgi:hypothetical protein
MASKTPKNIPWRQGAWLTPEILDLTEALITSVASVIDFKFFEKITIQRLLLFAFIPWHSPHSSITMHSPLSSSTH